MASMAVMQLTVIMSSYCITVSKITLFYIPIQKQSEKNPQVIKMRKLQKDVPECCHDYIEGEMGLVCLMSYSEHIHYSDKAKLCLLKYDSEQREQK